MKKIILVVVGIILLPLFAYLLIKPLNILYAQAVTYGKATHMHSEATPEALNPDPENFRFENYTKLGKKALGEALSCMFPVGTKKQYIDYILVDKAGAQYKSEVLPAPTDPKKKISHKYSYPMPWGMRSFASTDQQVGLYFENGLSVYDISLGGIGQVKCNKAGE